MDSHRFLEEEQARELLQLAYILDWRFSTGRSIEEESFRKLMRYLAKLSEITHCPFVKQLCLEAVTALNMSGFYGSAIKRTIFHDLAAHYGFPKLFVVEESKDG
jgi:hypothetical protein